MSSGGPPLFPLRAVAALFLARQHLDRPRARGLTPRRLSQLATDVGGIQMDSINVIDRAHYLTVWSRFGPYDRLVEKVEAAIATGGPLGSADFERDGKRSDAGWWNWKPATHALDYLWMSGRALIHSRTHFRKRFDLAARVMADALVPVPPSAEEFGRWHLGQSLHAMGAATTTDLRMYLTYPRTDVSERRRVLTAMLASGEVVEIAVQKPQGPARAATAWYALARDVPALSKAASGRLPSRGTTMLTPFDSFLWHR
jgi:uncharacterized protein YcaQ